MALDATTVKRKKLPRETVPVEDLGGDVIVRGLLLSERMRHDSLNTEAQKPLEGETEQQAKARAGAAVLPRTLHCCVVDEEGAPLMSAQEWDEFGGTNTAAAFLLFNTAMRLSGQNLEAVEKN